MARAFLVVLDSLGLGGAPDAGEYFNGDIPDTGANTLGHIAQAFAAKGRALQVPLLDGLGLGATLHLASGIRGAGLSARPSGLWGVGQEISLGKDTPSGHWEIAGLPVPWDWHYFPKTIPCFPDDITARICDLAGVDGILGNCHASGTEIIARLGAQHQATGWPICYTSADSVLQIAAHEHDFGLDRLHALCAALAPMLHDRRVGRVIARPFIGQEGAYQRTKNRRDYAMPPAGETLLDRAHGAGRAVIAIGKIADIFAHRAISQSHTGRDQDLIAPLASAVADAPEGSLTFANFVEFDSEFGHRRDVMGYGAHLEWFDRALAPIVARLRAGDCMILTADHGNDPTWAGSDHTRERVPILVACPDIAGSKGIGIRAMSDIGASLCAHLGLPGLPHGKGFL